MNFSSPEFIENLRQRDHESFTVLIEEYQQPLYKAAIKLKLSFDQAEEVVQQTWDTFFKSVENFEGRSHIRTYLFGILYNKIKEVWRSNKKYMSDFSDEDIDRVFDSHGHYQQPAQSPESWVSNKELGILIEKHMEKLPENQRMAFYLKEVQGESTEEICKILGVSVTNLGVLVYRAKMKLRLSLEKELDA